MSRRSAKVVVDSDGFGDHTVTVEYQVAEAEHADGGRWVARGYHSAPHPEDGATAVWADGETVPDWAVPEVTRTEQEPPA